MRTDGDAMFGRGGDGPPHHRRIATVKSASDVRRRHVRQHRVVGADLVRAEALSHVAIDVDLHAAALSDGAARWPPAPAGCWLRAQGTAAAPRRVRSVGNAAGRLA